MDNNNKKIFLVINLSFFGDVLLTNVLCQNIKKNYPDSKVVFLVSKPFYDAAKYQDSVDDVIVFDKKGEHKGFWGILKFIKNCPYYKKIDTAFIMYGNDRGILISYLLGAKTRISGPKKFTKHLLTHIHIETDDFQNMQDANANHIKALTGKKTEILPIKYNAHPESDTLVQELKKQFEGQDIIGLCCISKKKEKDMPLDTAIQIINLANKDNKVIFYLGAGKESREFSDNLKKQGCVKFIDLTNTTSIKQLGNVLTICSSLISVDTGTMHLGCAVGTPVASVFYKTDMIKKWAPRDFLYKSSVITEDYSAENIYNQAIKLSESVKQNNTDA